MPVNPPRSPTSLHLAAASRSCGGAQPCPGHRGAFVPGPVPGSRTRRLPPTPSAPTHQLQSAEEDEGAAAGAASHGPRAAGQGRGSPVAAALGSAPPGAAEVARCRSLGAGCRSPSGSRGGGEWGLQLKRATLRRRCRPAGWAGWRGGGCRQRRDAPPAPPQARSDAPAPVPALPREAGAAPVPRTRQPLVFGWTGGGE